MGYTSSVYCSASVLTLAAIALDRYYSIVDCLHYNSRCTAWRTGAAVLWIWLQAMLTSCPPLLGWSNISFVSPMYSCAVNWASSPSYTVFMAALCFLLPAIIILFCYVKIVRVAQHHAQRIHSLQQHFQHSRGQNISSPLESSHQCSAVNLEMHDPSRLVYYVSRKFVSDSQFNVPHPKTGITGEPTSQLEGKSISRHSSRRLLTFLAHLQSGSTPQNSHFQQHGIMRLFMVIAAFFLCWTPYIGVALVQATETALSRSASLVPPAAVTFSYWLVLFNSDINPILYALLSKRFQGALQNLKRKIQARLGMVQRAEDRTANREGGRYATPTNVIANVTDQHCQGGGPHQNGSVYSVFTMNTSFSKRHEQEANEVLLPGSMLSSSSFSTSSSSVLLCHKCSRNTPGNSDCLQVSCKPQGWDKLHRTSVIKERHATFFYGQIAVQVEQEIC